MGGLRAARFLLGTAVTISQGRKECTMLEATAFEPDATGPVWLLVLPGEWTGDWGRNVRARVEERKDGWIVCGTRHGRIAFAATAERAIRARGARLMAAGNPPQPGPSLVIAWQDRLWTDKANAAPGHIG
jgi:hypothetical protein